MSERDNFEKEVEAIGWEAIDSALNNIYSNQTPKHYGTILPYALGGNDPLEGISVYERKNPIPHWHYITYGFSELYEKECDNLEYSGFGFELTFRLKREDSDTEPPGWALNFLQNLARYVFSSGNCFASGHYLNANGPIAAETNTLLKSIAFIEDPELPCITSKNGKVEFLQVVGLTLDEEDAIKCWNTSKALDLFSKYLPLSITDLSRKSLLNNKDVQTSIENGISNDGSSTGTLFNDKLQWESKRKLLGGTSYEITLGSNQVKTISKVLKGRIFKKRDLSLVGKDNIILFSFSEEPSIKVTDNNLQFYLNDNIALEIISELIPKERKFKLKTMKNVEFKILKTEIRNQDGEIVEVIG